MRIAIAGSTGLIGTQLTTLAREEGHDVVEIAGETGFDLLAPEAGRLETALDGSGAVVDVTSTRGLLGDQETFDFFTAVARSLGRAATAAGVPRTVTLSIVGVEKSPDYGYYVAKLAQERVAREESSGARVLRATQFHDFARQMLEWNRDGDVTRVPDVPTQPVDTREIVRLLLDLATSAVDHDVELAGPRPERLVDLVRRYAAHVGEAGVTVEPVEPPASLAAGAMLPDHDGVLLRGVDWATWLEAQPATVRT
jgi:uncharacterized protein YbjT (DUF2867 family)